MKLHLIRSGQVLGRVDIAGTLWLATDTGFQNVNSISVRTDESGPPDGVIITSADGVMVANGPLSIKDGAKDGDNKIFFPSGAIHANFLPVD